jgi:hypothetical protein
MFKSRPSRITDPTDKAMAETPDSPATGTSEVADSTANANAHQKWWDKDDFPYSAPWWLRYPVCTAVFYGSYWSFFEWERRAGWIFGPLLLLIGIGLARELLFGVLVAMVVGLILWALGAAIAALPVSLAIVIGAMIIAQAMKR